MPCLSKFKSSPSTSTSIQIQTQTQTQVDLNSCSPLSQVNSTDGTPKSSSPYVSPTFNLSHEYKITVQSSSYNQIRSIIEGQLQVENGHTLQDDAHHLRLSQVLNPNKECVDQALRNTNLEATLTRLVSTYFHHSEYITTICLSLYQCVRRARSLYAPITDLLQLFPHDRDSITDSNCDRAFDVFVEFDTLGNPFQEFTAPNYFNDMTRKLSQLKEQLDHRLHKSHCRVRFMQLATTGSSICLIGTVVGVVVSAVVISTHALAAIVGLLGTPLCPIYVPAHLKKEQLAQVAQLDAAAKATYVHKTDLDTIDRLVDLLHTAVEGDRQLIRFGLERRRDIHPILEVVKHLRHNHNKLFDQLKELEEHIYLCFIAVNRFRANLLEQIHLQHSSNS